MFELNPPTPVNCQNDIFSRGEGHSLLRATVPPWTRTFLPRSRVLEVSGADQSELEVGAQWTRNFSLPSSPWDSLYMEWPSRKFERIRLLLHSIYK